MIGKRGNPSINFRSYFGQVVLNFFCIYSSPTTVGERTSLKPTLLTRLDDTQWATQACGERPIVASQKEQMKVSLLALATATIISATNAFALKQARSVTVYYSSSTSTYTIKQNVIDKENGIAYGSFQDDLKETGWEY